ncbi:MAG: hypothetical protein A4S09_02120 [Proteobacteria bacterium SG_bin7]|nr:MAG: hypothetical protein A4S09_02120 [Proteobacteria bacterium SG_bin7]
MRIIIYSSILEKLKNKHGVSAGEAEEVFLNRESFVSKRNAATESGNGRSLLVYINDGQGARIKSGLLH